MRSENIEIERRREGEPVAAPRSPPRCIVSIAEQPLMATTVNRPASISFTNPFARSPNCHHCVRPPLFSAPLRDRPRILLTGTGTTTREPVVVV
ncbi:hypothetical protein SESBI_44955 [Sesbania bispinosa]|nr:hypothetical protein SESBI_44955 [Sesbania bispinosa]